MSAVKKIPRVTRHTPFDQLPEFLSVHEFAIVADLGRSAAYDVAQTLPHKRFGKIIRIHKSALAPDEQARGAA